MMKYIIVSLAFLLFSVQLCHGDERKVAKAQAMDGQWWDYFGQMKGGGCIRDSLSNLKLNQQEQQFVKDVLDKLPSPPHQITKEVVYKVFKRKPDSEVIVNLYYNNFGPGTDPQRGVVVSIYNKKLSRIFWLQPNKFVLVKSLP